MNDICIDIEKISNKKSFYENQALMLNSPFLVDKMFTGKFNQYKIVDDKYQLFESKHNQKESDTVMQQSKEQPDTTDMLDLKSDESAAQRRNFNTNLNA